MLKKFLFLLLFLPFSVSAYYDLGKPSGFVNDYANSLTVEQRQAIQAKLSDFEKATSNEVAVAIIPSLKGDTVENFAVKLFQTWGIGKKNKDNGVLVLISLKDRKMRIEVGYGLEGALTDAQSFWIMENVMKPAFKAGDYYAGINGALDKIIAATKGEYVPSSSDNTKNKQSVDGILNSAWIIFPILIVLLRGATAGLARSKSWWGGGLAGGVIALIVGFVWGFVFVGLAALVVLVPLGLLFDFLASRAYGRAKERGYTPWWFGGGGSGGGGGFGGFGGGGSGGGGSSDSWQ